MPEVVEALYRFQPQSQDDLELSPGEKIEVEEHLSADWARGKNLSTGKVGVFPKNYVKPASEAKEAFSRPPASVPSNDTGSSSNSYPQKFDEKQHYQPPQASWQSGPPQYQQYQQYQPPQQYQQYQPPQQQYQAPPQQYQQPPPQEQPQQQQGGGHHGQFGNLARRFGDSVMFGAGATLGSDIINKIF